MDGLLDPPLDEGNDRFPPTNLEFTSIDTRQQGDQCHSARTAAKFNIRFNDIWTAESLAGELRARLDRAARQTRLRPGREPVRYQLDLDPRSSPSFLTRDEALIETLSAAVREATGAHAGAVDHRGTSDARFIKDYCPVVEFLAWWGQTMHIGRRARCAVRSRKPHRNLRGCSWSAGSTISLPKAGVN